jgi:hypothetical protein
MEANTHLIKTYDEFKNYYNGIISKPYLRADFRMNFLFDLGTAIPQAIHEYIEKKNEHLFKEICHLETPETQTKYLKLLYSIHKNKSNVLKNGKCYCLVYNLINGFTITTIKPEDITFELEIYPEKNFFFQILIYRRDNHCIIDEITNVYLKST